jgi:transposase InsO family protein
MGIKEVLSAPHSPWQRAYVERVIGSIRRECLDHVLVLNEANLRRTIQSYLVYYHGSRTHLSLAKDTPERRTVQPPELGRVVAVPILSDSTIGMNAGPPEETLNRTRQFPERGG